MCRFTISMLAIALVFFLISHQLANACFLNSCPYRRYGRTLRCSTCGPESEGLCVQEGRCCNHNACFLTSECTYASVCPELFCKIGRKPGYCVKNNYCCTADGCQISAMC